MREQQQAARNAGAGGTQRSVFDNAIQQADTPGQQSRDRAREHGLAHQRVEGLARQLQHLDLAERGGVVGARLAVDQRNLAEPDARL